jgi:hypothetical protein
MKAKAMLAAALFNFAVAAFSGVISSNIFDKAFYISLNGSIGIVCLIVALKRNRRNPK